MAAWDSQFVQFVWFVTSVEGLRADTLYNALLNDDPETVQRNKSPTPATPFLSIATGSAEGRNYQVQVQPGRVDLNVSVIDNQYNEEVVLFDTAEALNTTLSCVDAADIEWPAAIRLSVVATLMRPAKSENEAKASFLESANYQLPFPDFSDPIIQINRRRVMSDGRQMNRVMRFGVAATQQFMLGTGSGIAAPAVAISNQRFASSMTLDFNSVPDGRTIDTVSQRTILKELVDEVIRVATIGTPIALAD